LLRGLFGEEPLFYAVFNVAQNKLHAFFVLGIYYNWTGEVNGCVFNLSGRDADYVEGNKTFYAF
jgi:hypothetical protein